MDELAVKDKLAAIGAIPVTCKTCGYAGHVAADCAATMGYVARDRDGREVASVPDDPGQQAAIGQRIGEWRRAGYAVTREPLSSVAS